LKGIDNPELQNLDYLGSCDFFDWDPFYPEEEGLRLMEDR
jgi:hypothetical protein